MKLEDPRFIKSLIEVTHIEFQTYDIFHKHLICTAGIAEQLLGYTHEQFLKLSDNYYKEIIHPDDWPAVTAGIEKLRHSSVGQVVETTARMMKTDASYIWIYCRKLATDRDAEGNAVTVTTIAENITDFIDLQQQLREKVEQLNAISYMNSHVVRGPVASIIGLVDLIEEKSITSSHNLQILHYLREAIQKLDQVIRDINSEARK